MKYGICAPFGKAGEVKAAGFDYIELPLNKIGVMEEDEFQEGRRKLEALSLPVLACSLLLPASITLIGENYSEAELDSYLGKAFSRMRELGCGKVVFGSGKSRFVPSGMSYQEAYPILVERTKHMVEIAGGYGIRIAIEPLNRKETNLINLLTEGAALASLTGASLLCDAFHLRVENESVDSIALCAPLVHTHIATKDGRRYPLVCDSEVMEFVSALKKTGYDGTLSIEGKTDDMAADGPAALAVLKKAWEEA